MTQLSKRYHYRHQISEHIGGLGKAPIGSTITTIAVHAPLIIKTI